MPVITAAAAGSRDQNLGDGRIGQFTSPCEFSHRAPDDPIVFPGRPGASHRHDFIGNRSTDARSTRASLRHSGTLCTRRANPSAYWVPTLYEVSPPTRSPPTRRAVEPSRVQIYYRTAGRDPRTIVPFPRGLRVVTGDAQATRPAPVDTVAWSCVAPGDPGRRLRRPPRCGPGDRLKLRIRFPECWDGRSLDSPDHSSHLASALPTRGRRHRSCPESHPVAVPELVMSVHYRTRGGRGVRLASGRPETAHADFFNAWDQGALTSLVRRCLNRDVRCRTR